MNDELKPCPFCGSDDIRLDFDDDRVQCEGCKVVVFVSDRRQPDKKIAQWNRRVSSLKEAPDET